MQLVYATGQPRFMEFAIASTPDRVPAGARVFAACTAESAEEHLDEHTFGAMTDEEFFTFKQLVHRARQLEAERPAGGGFDLIGSARSLYARLCGR